MPIILGENLATPDDVARVVSEQLRGVGPWSAPSDYTPVEGVVRAVEAAGPAWAAAFAEALLAALTDEAVTVRAGAIAALPAVRGHVDGDRAVAAFDAHSERFADAAWPDGYPTMPPTLEHALVVGLAGAEATGGNRLAAFYRERLAPPTETWALLGLAAAAPAWVVANAAAVVPRDTIIGVLSTLKDAEAREQVVRALSPWGEEGRALLADPYWALLELPEPEKAHLAALLGAP